MKVDAVLKKKKIRLCPKNGARTFRRRKRKTEKIGTRGKKTEEENIRIKISGTETKKEISN